MSLFAYSLTLKDTTVLSLWSCRSFAQKSPNLIPLVTRHGQWKYGVRPVLPVPRGTEGTESTAGTEGTGRTPYFYCPCLLVTQAVSEKFSPPPNHSFKVPSRSFFFVIEWFIDNYQLENKWSFSYSRVTNLNLRRDTFWPRTLTLKINRRFIHFES